MADEIKNFKSKKQIATDLTDTSVKTEGLLPQQTPIRDENLSKGGRKTSRFKDTVLGVNIDWVAWENAPADRKNFYFVENKEARDKVINKQWSRYLNLQTPAEGLNKDTTIRGAIKIFDQQNPDLKIKLMEEKGFNLDLKIGDLEAKAPVLNAVQLTQIPKQGRLDELKDIINIFAVNEAVAEESPYSKTGRLDDLTLLEKTLTDPIVSKVLDTFLGDMGLDQASQIEKSLKPDSLDKVPLGEEFDSGVLASSKFFGDMLPYIMKVGMRQVLALKKGMQTALLPLKDKTRIQSAFTGLVNPDEIPEGYVGGEVARMMVEGGAKPTPATIITAGVIGAAADLISYDIIFGNFGKRLEAGYRNMQQVGVDLEAKAYIDSLTERFVKYFEKTGFFPKGWNEADKIGRTRAWVTQNLELNSKFGDWLIARQTPSKILFRRLGPGQEAGALRFLPENSHLKSNLKAVAFARLPNAVSGIQALKTILNSGISPGEIKASGVDAFLQSKEKFTKDEILNHIENNKAKVDVVVKSDRSIIAEEERLAKELVDITQKYNDIEDILQARPYVSGQPVRWMYKDKNGNPVDVPNEHISILDEYSDKKTAYDDFVAGDELYGKGDTKFSQYTLPGGTNYKEVLIKAPAKENKNFPMLENDREDVFHSSHWDEPNILVHYRTTDRVDADGKKVLFIEEIQSDWALAIKKAGKDFPSLSHPLLKDWHELALKDIIRNAVENGYDKVAFINGTQTADRYRLSTKVEAIQWYENTAGRKQVELSPKGGSERIMVLDVGLDGKIIAVSSNTTTGFIGKRLDEVIGKEITKEINSSEKGIVKGKGLDVGGEWAKTLYDKIIPTAAQKYISKWGGKVEDIKVDASGVKQITRDVHGRGRLKPNSWVVLDADGNFRYGGPTKEEAIDWAEKNKIDNYDVRPNDLPGGTMSQKGFALTPTMIREITEVGQPMFGSRLAGSLMDRLNSNRGSVGIEGQERMPDDLEPENIPEIMKHLEVKSEYEAASQKPPLPPKPTAVSPGEPEEEGSDWIPGQIEYTENKKPSIEDVAAMEEFVKDYLAAENDLGDAVKSFGGVKPYAFGKEKEELIDIPKEFIAKKGKGATLDQMATELSSQGFIFSDGEELRQALIDLRGKKKFSYSQETIDYLRNKKIGKVEVLKVGNKLSKPLATTNVKPLVRKTTGQFEKEPPTIKESAALKRSMKRQEQAARRASIETKKRVTGAAKLYKGIARGEIQEMGYEERQQVRALQERIKTEKIRSLEGLQKIYAEIQAIKIVGKQKVQDIIKQKNLVHQLKTEILKGLVSKGEIDKARPVLKSTAKTAGMPKVARLLTLRPTRIFDMLDGGQKFEGPHNQIFYNDVNKAVDTELKESAKRKLSFTQFLKANKKTISYFGEKFEIEGEIYTKEEMIGVYNAAKNPEKLASVVYGNNISPETINKIVSKLTPFDKATGDFIEKEYDANWERLNRAFIEYTDGKQELGKVKGYSPIKRLGRSGDPTDQELASEMLERKGLKKAYAERGFTKERVKIPKEFQTPVRLDEVSIWYEQLAKQEHFISHGNLVKQLQRIVSDKEYRENLLNNPKLGQAYIDTLQHYVDRVANPRIYRGFGQAEKLATALRGNVATAYLAYNLVTILKQAPSGLLFLGKVDPTYILSGYQELTSDYANTLKMIQDKSGQMANRSIEREMEELKNINVGSYDKIKNKIGRAGFEGIYLMDRYVTYGGWLGAYRQGLDAGLSDEEAARAADKIALMTQPAASAKDLAEIYASDEFLNWFTQFTNQLNQIYNILTYDIPAQAKGGEYKNALLGLLGVAMSSYLIYSISHGRFPTSKKDIKTAFSEQATSSVPIIGSMIVSANNGFKGSTVPAMASGEAIAEITYQIARDKKDSDAEDQAWEIGISKALELLAVSQGLPYNQPKKTLKGALRYLEGETDDPRELIWSEYMLKTKEDEWIIK